MSTDDLEDRLRRLGQAPIAPEVEATHRHAIAQAVPDRPRARFGWKAVALAAFAGFFAGSTALAAAGSLPAPAQDVAHDTLGAVGISVPRSTEGCPAGTSYRNHGEYVSAVEAAGGDVRAAAHSDCGKPVHSSKGDGNDKHDGCRARRESRPRRRSLHRSAAVGGNPPRRRGGGGGPRRTRGDLRCRRRRARR